MAKKDFNLPKHGDIDTKNLYVCPLPPSFGCVCKSNIIQVIKACQSLQSRGYIKTRFSWQYYYYTLTPEVCSVNSCRFF